MPTFRKRDTAKARDLRNTATPAERKLWTYLSARKLGRYKFSRQMPLGPYVADFLCREHRLIVEIDGYSHDMRQTADAARTGWLEENGFVVLRFSNGDVMERIEGVLLAIAGRLDDLSRAYPQPLPQAGGA